MPRPVRSELELRLPPDGAHVALLRTTAAALAARLDFTLDDIEDLRILVSEAAALVLEATAEDPATTELVVRLAPIGRRIHLAVSAPCTPPATIDRSSFSWQVLSALGGEIAVGEDPEHLSVELLFEAPPLDAP